MASKKNDKRLIDDYFSLTQKYFNEYGDNSVVLMQVGAFYEVYGLLDKKNNLMVGSKITDYSNALGLRIVPKHITCNDKPVYMTGFRDYGLEEYLGKLQKEGFTIIVYKQDTPSSNTTRSLEGIYSPGTIFTSEESVLTNNTMCLWLKNLKTKNNDKLIIGISTIDILTGKVNIFEYVEDFLHTSTTYDELERLVSVYKPSEVIIISNLKENEINDIISYTNINASLIHKILLDNSENENTKKALLCEKQVYQIEILNKYYKTLEKIEQRIMESAIACQSFCYLLNFIYEHNPYLVHKINDPVFEDMNARLTLANHSLKQLNVINDSNKKSKNSSVLTLLNNAITNMGKRNFVNLLVSPCCDVDTLNKEYEITEYLLEKKNYNEIRNILTNIKDIEKIYRKITSKKITPRYFYFLFENLKTIKQFYNKFMKDKTIKKYIHSKINGDISLYCENINKIISKTINLDKCKDIDSMSFDDNFICRNIDEKLDSKEQLYLESKDKLFAVQKYLSSLINKYEKKEALFVKIHETEKNGFRLEATKKRCEVLNQIIPKSVVTIPFTSSYNSLVSSFELDCSSIVILPTATSNANSISNNQISELCSNIYKIRNEMRDLILIVYKNFISEVESLKEEFFQTINFVALVDILQNKCYIADKYNYKKPTIDISKNSGYVSAKNLRHCLVEQLQTDEVYVPNDITIGSDTKGILLYGTNAVGKTCLIKALGISVIMAQSGLYVPASEYNFYPYTRIFTRILGNDNIFKGLSTFAVEMTELRTILKYSDENSLILGDELCSGTESESAQSIFVSGIQYLHKRSSNFIFATHFHEIVNYEEIKDLEFLKLFHMTVVYDKILKKLIYDRKLKEGPGWSTYGLEVCKSLDLPIEFLDNAYNIRTKYNEKNRGILSLTQSRYNSQKIKGLCEICKINQGQHIHHLSYQKDSDSNGFINTFHKNNLGNLCSICEDCHNKIHKDDKQLIRKKTSDGYEILEK